MRRDKAPPSPVRGVQADIEEKQDKALASKATLWQSLPPAVRAVYGGTGMGSKSGEKCIFAVNIS